MMGRGLSGEGCNSLSRRLKINDSTTSESSIGIVDDKIAFFDLYSLTGKKFTMQLNESGSILLRVNDVTVKSL